MNVSKWKKHFSDNPQLPHMMTVMIHHKVSLNDLFPYFNLNSSIELCKSSFYGCQLNIPLLSMEDMSSMEPNEGKLTVYVSFKASKARFPTDDYLVLNHIESIINEIYQEKANRLNLEITFEETDDDGITRTQWKIINEFYHDINKKLYRAPKK